MGEKGGREREREGATVAAALPTSLRPSHPTPPLASMLYGASLSFNAASSGSFSLESGTIWAIVRSKIWSSYCAFHPLTSGPSLASMSSLICSPFAAKGSV